MTETLERYYVYLGDRLTDPALRGRVVWAVLRPDGRCITSRLGTMLVELEDGTRHVVLRRWLRREGQCPSSEREHREEG